MEAHEKRLARLQCSPPTIWEAKPAKVAEYVAPLGFDGWLFQKVNSYRKKKA